MNEATDKKRDRWERSFRIGLLFRLVLAGGVLATAAGLSLAIWIARGAFGKTVAIIAGLAVFTTWLRFILWVDRQEESSVWSLLLGIFGVGVGVLALIDPPDETHLRVKGVFVLAMGSILVVWAIWEAVSSRLKRGGVRGVR